IRPRPAPAAWPMLAVAAAACVALLAVGIPALRGRGVAEEDREFQSRGPALASAEFVVYRIRAGAAPERAPRRVHRGDELAFAYTNAAGFSHLLVFGVDAKGDVPWYHPEWSDAAATPQAVPIAKGADIHELPEAVAQTLAGSTLRLYAV